MERGAEGAVRLQRGPVGRLRRRRQCRRQGVSVDGCSCRAGSRARLHEYAGCLGVVLSFCLVLCDLSSRILLTHKKSLLL